MLLSKMKVKSLTIVAVVLAFGLTSCAATGDSTAVPSRDLGTPVAGTIKAGALHGVTMTYAAAGGIGQDSHKAAVWDPFSQESGAVVNQDTFDPAKLKAMNESGDVQWDVIDTTSLDAERFCGTTYQKLDRSKIDMTSIPKGTIVGDCTVPSFLYGYVVAYNTDLFGSNPPTSAADFFDLKKFPGNRGVANSPYIDAQVLQFALVAEGQATDKLSLADIPKAINKYKSLGDNFVPWTTGAQSQQQLESGEVAMSLVWSGRGYGAAKNGAHIAPMFDQWMILEDVLAVPAKAKDPEASMAAINYFLGATQQAKFTELSSYPPVNVNSKPKTDALLDSWLTTDKLDSGIPENSSFWIKNYDALSAAWAAWVSGV